MISHGNLKLKKFPYFYTVCILGVLITEQSFQFLDSMNNQGIPDIKDWIKNLYSCIPTDEIKFLSNMTEDKIKTIVNGVLSKIPETKTGKWFYNAEIVIKDLTETRRNNLIKFQH